MTGNPLLDEMITLDFGEYWKGCLSKQLPVIVIFEAGRYGMKIDLLPKEVKEKLRSPEVQKAWRDYITAHR